jgi:hypothetical protein
MTFEKELCCITIFDGEYILKLITLLIIYGT